MPTLIGLLREDTKPLDVRAASADALTRILKWARLPKEQKQDAKQALKLFEPDWERFTIQQQQMEAQEQKREAQAELWRQEFDKRQHESDRAQYPLKVAAFCNAKYHAAANLAAEDLMSSNYKEFLEADESTKSKLVAFSLLS